MRVFLVLAALATAVLLLFGCASFQRKLLYHPTHRSGDDRRLTDWMIDGRHVGVAREVSAPAAVWLFLHGNAGQAADRVYALSAFSERDAVYILEYPGYGPRPGAPSLGSFNAAAREAYTSLRARFPRLPVCVASESIGSGPACCLAASDPPPDKFVLVVPFDVLARVASDHFPLLPAWLLLHDNWDNVASLAGYRGPLEIFAATDDAVIPIAHARALAASKPQAVFHEIPGGHNDWPLGDKVRIAFP